MEDGVKELKLQGLAGWVKKAPGRLLASYKDRFIHVDKTEVVLYESEDLQTCVERINLENYDRCHELKSPFKKRHRLILIRSNKSGNKVSDVKFQTPTAEEKEAWIKALTEGINRAKNKVFDEVKVDESSNLEHVTRTRPKGNRNRRPPTRIHMKEVAVVSSDGFLRLDLDLEDAVMPTGNHYTNIDVTDAPKEAVHAQDKQSEEIKPQDSPKKNRVKPPMPPTKEAKRSSGADDDASEKRVLMPPLPPSKADKAFISPTEEVTENTEKSPDAKKKAVAPPAPPNKPRPSSPTSSLSEPSQTRLKPAPPSPPSKELKPSHPAPDQEKDDDKRKEAEATAEEPEEEGHAAFTDALETINGDGSPCTKQDSEEASREYASSRCPPATPKKTPEEAARSEAHHTEEKPTVSPADEREDQTVPGTCLSSPQAEEHTGSGPVPSIVCSDEHAPDGFSLGPLLCHLPGEKKRKAEEKSVDSGQHSDDDSEASGSEDTLVASTAALRGSHAELDSVDVSGRDSDDIQDVTLPHVKSVVVPIPQVKPRIPLKPSTKVRSASIGDLLSGSSACVQVRPHARAASQSSSTPTDDVAKLKSEVALEMEKTDELLSRISQPRDEGGRAGGPEDLLAEAMEKLRKAEHVLREVRKLKLAKNPVNRMSW